MLHGQLCDGTFRAGQIALFLTPLLKYFVRLHNYDLVGKYKVDSSVLRVVVRLNVT